MRAVMNPLYTAYVQRPIVVADLRIWAGNPAPYTTQSGTEAAYTLGTQFAVSSSSALQSIWWYSPAGSAVLPGICGIWDIGTQGLITEDVVPFWQDLNGTPAIPGDGWVYCDFTAAQVTLVAGLNYSVAVFQPQPGVPWWATAPGYWTSGSGLGGQNGITDGKLSAPNTGSSVNGQGSYDITGTWQFPGTNPGNGEVFYVDVDVI